MNPAALGEDARPRPGSRAISVFLGRDESAFERTTQAAYHAWLDHIRTAAGCTRPVRLTGQLVTLEADTGRLLTQRDTDTMPDGVVYKPCGNRRERVCPSCAEVYRADAFQLIRAGMIGGKGVPASVATHPAVFATFTAPSFGPVHTRNVQRHTCANRRRCDCRPEPCHARRTRPTCCWPAFKMPTSRSLTMPTRVATIRAFPRWLFGEVSPVVGEVPLRRCR
jgi:hypothetical protein